MHDTKFERQSNYELLRIVAILLIIAHHIVVHVFFQQLKDGTYISYYNNAWFNEPRFFLRLIIPEIFSPLGKVGVNIFMIISGYFMIEKNQVDIIKISKKVLSQLAFATVALMVSSFMVAFFFGLKREFGSLITLNIFNDDWWFIGFYYIIVVVVAIFFSKFFFNCSKKQYGVVLASLFTVITLGFTGSLLNNLIPEFRTLLAGVLMFLWGGYCRRFNPLKTIKTPFLIAVFPVTLVFIWLSYYNAEMSKIGYYLRIMPTEEFIHTTDTNMYGSYGIIPIVIAVVMFELFHRIKMKKHYCINSVAQGTLMIYLLHDNSFVRTLLCSSIDLVTPLHNQPIQFCLIVAALVVGIFIVGMIGYYIYKSVMRLIKGLRIVYEA